VNTHRGAIFSIGLLSAAAGRLAAQGTRIAADHVCATVARKYGPSIIHYADVAETACGKHLKPQRELFGARAEACAGFPTGLQIGLPAYRFALRKTGCRELAAIQSLFALISRIDDTNLLRRGGQAGLRFAKKRASDFLIRGGVLARDWSRFAQEIHRQFVSRNLSPGGSADLLGVTLFLDGLERLSDATCTFI
jgi:triphosphoribosyl-dephospho-CoA synthase